MIFKSLAEKRAETVAISRPFAAVYKIRLEKQIVAKISSATQGRSICMIKHFNFSCQRKKTIV